MTFDPNDLYYYMLDKFAKNYLQTKRDEVLYIFNEGGARAGKTIDTIHLIYSICDHNRNKGLQIGFFRQTLKDAREKLYEQDFKKCLTDYMQVFDPGCARSEKSSPEYNLFGNNIFFRGLEDSTEQVSYDIVFINEMLEIPDKSLIAGLKMRCKMLFIGDWNPKYTDHWAFNFEDQPNTFYTRTTYRNNKHCPVTIKKEIEAFCPWMIEDLGLPKDKRRPNKVNIKNGTVDEFMWTVYGEGNRCAREGLVFRNVTYVKELPDTFESRYFGMDFGKTTGTNAFAEVRSVRLNGVTSLYYDCPIYASIENLRDLYDLIVKHVKDYKEHIIVYCDCAEPQKIADLNTFSSRDERSLTFIAAKKWEGCVKWRIDVMNRHPMYLVNRKHIKNEQENYRYQLVNGIATNNPEKNGKDHFFDAAGYAIQYDEMLR